MKTHDPTPGSLALAIDKLDEHECNEETLIVAIGTITESMGAEAIDAFTAGYILAKHLQDKFRSDYWAENTYSNKVAVMMAMAETAIDKIERGLDETVKKVVREVWEKEHPRF